MHDILCEKIDALRRLSGMWREGAKEKIEWERKDYDHDADTSTRRWRRQLKEVLCWRCQVVLHRRRSMPLIVPHGVLDHHSM